MKKKKWKSPQALIVIAIITVIFAYIFIDMFHTNPQFKNEMKDMKGRYTELSDFLDIKVPIIDSTFKEHAVQINNQKLQINVIDSTLKHLEIRE